MLGLINSLGSNKPDERFAYAEDIGYQFICNQDTESPLEIDVEGYECVFIQFNAVHSTIAHRGYAIAYEEIKSKWAENKSTFQLSYTANSRK